MSRIDHDTPPRSERLTDEEVEANQDDRGDPEMELESARRVVNACRHTVLTSEFPGSAMNGACASCIAAYAQQLRADRRLMRQALERWEPTKAALVDVATKLLDVADDRGDWLHSPECDCDVCELLTLARAALRLAEAK